ncbi:hypothetical protein [Shewanella sp. HL-SH2]|uniref:hypothetical protein n=1 Tax=Shewanella sp. HL-SH2 TaxID=3436238 RepID=UPI003EBB708F
MDNKSKYAFQISYDTLETANHTIDAEKLGEAIVSMSKVLKNANKLINGEESELSLEVKAHTEGSFVVEFVSYLSSVGVNPMSILGFMGTTGAGVTVISALKQLKSRKIRIVEQSSDGMSVLKLSDDTDLTLPSQVAELVANKHVRDSLDTIIKAPLEGSTAAKFVIKDDQGAEVNIITDEEAKDFKTIAQNVVEEVTEVTERKEVYFTKVNFESSTGWQVRLPDDSLVAVAMKDEAFKERVNKRDEKFSKTALFSVRLKTIKTHRYGTSPTYKRELLEVVRQRGN